MLGFIQFLMEARDHVAAAKEEFGDILNHSHDTYLPPELHGKGHEIIDHLRQFDPTPSGKYMGWVAREYHRGNIRLGSNLKEDKHKIHAMLGAFQSAPNKISYPEEPGTHHTTSSLLRPNVEGISTNILHHSARDLGKKLEGPIAARLAKLGPSKREMKKQNTQHGATKVWENEHVEFWHLHEHEAAARFDPGRSWCTTRDKGTFKEHSYASPLMVAVPKAKGRIPKHHGNVQWHIDSGQTMDKNNEPIDFEYTGGEGSDDTVDKMHPLMKRAFAEAHFAHPEIAKLNYQNENSLMKKSALSQVRDVRDGKLTVESQHGKMYEPLQKHVYDHHPDKVPDMIRHMGGHLHADVQFRIAHKRPELLSHMIEHVGENLHRVAQSIIKTMHHSDPNHDHVRHMFDKVGVRTDNFVVQDSIEKRPDLVSHIIRQKKDSLSHQSQRIILNKHPEHAQEMIEHMGENLHEFAQESILKHDHHRHLIPHMIRASKGSMRRNNQSNIVRGHPEHISELITHTGQNFHSDSQFYILQKHPEHIPHMLQSVGPKTTEFVQSGVAHNHSHLIPHMIKHVGKELSIGTAEYIRQNHPEHAPLLKKAGIK